MTIQTPVTLIRGRRPSTTTMPLGNKPPWLRVRAPGGPKYNQLKRLIRTLSLNTVCEEANCPNIGECWHHGTATFMILGGVCTRACGYCNVIHGAPHTLDSHEPDRVAEAISTLDLQYVVITSVDRDDLIDGGASIFAATINAIRARTPKCRIEVLIPDFSDRELDLHTVLDAGPDVLNHNIETIARLYRTARPGGRYHWALRLLRRARQYRPVTPTKSGVMVGLGESRAELDATLDDLRRVGCELLTVGQYLRPSVAHLPVSRYYNLREFDEIRQYALELGFSHVEAGPLVRSSYHAHEQLVAFEQSGKR